ncbi:MAG: hypothetical protein HWE11_02465 [Gammaproteobacteria bacterium]|nr:hypothetical protein [Gammaproteobacteria bacterium]
MKLEAITAKVKPRSGWESIDLGFRMVQQHWLALYIIWLGITLPIFATATWLFTDHLFWVVFLFWWCKPIFETALLNYLARALFGEFPTFGSTLKTFHRYAFTQWFANLTWRRFSFTRSMDLPIAQLEGLSGSRRGRRIRTLHAFNSGAAVWLTILLFLLQIAFYFNIFGILFWLIPEVYIDSFFTEIEDLLWAENSVSAQLFQAYVMYLVFTFFAPFYVAGGFSIYINQRTILEAWDIELVFKKLAQRVTANKDYLSSISSSVLIILFSGTLVFFSPTSPAQEDPSNSDVSSYSISEEKKREVKKEAQAILNSPPFVNSTQDSELIFEIDFDFSFDKDDEDKEEEPKARSTNTRDLGMGGAFVGLAQLFEVVLWLVVIALVVWFVIKLIGRQSFSRKKSKKLTERPEVLFGLDLNDTPLPDDPAQQARKLWQSAEHRQALSLLLKAALVRLIDDHNCRFEDGYTELECARVVNHATESSVAQYFSELIAVWRMFAYAHQLPDSETFHFLTDNFNSIFSQPTTAEETASE